MMHRTWFTCLILVLGCTQEVAETTRLPLTPFRVDARGEAGKGWGRVSDTRSSVVTEPGAQVKIEGRGQFSTAVARLNEAECLVNGNPIEGGEDWVEVRLTLSKGAELSARGGRCAWDSPRFVRSSTKLNVLLIVLDTLRADRMEVSQALMEFEQRSYRFWEAYANSSWTKPSHQALFSGRFPPIRLSKNVKTLASRLSESGWRSTAITGGAVVKSRSFGRGFQKFVTDFNAVESADALIQQELGQDEPTFLFFHTYEIHDPYRHFEDTAGPFGKTVTYSYGTNDPEVSDREDRARVRQLYDAGIRFTDRRLSELFSVVDWNSTLVVVTSDHGEPFWEHGYWRHGKGLYQEVLRVPLLIHIPESLRRQRGLEPPREIRARAQLVDVAPTILDLLGLGFEGEVDGRSLVPLMAGQRESPRPVIAREIRQTKFNKSAVIVGPFKLIRTWSRETGEPVRLELYNLSEDPNEQVDVGESNPEVVERLFALLEGRTVKEEVIETLDANELRALEALGYINN